MTDIDFSKVSDNTLILSVEGAKFLGVSLRYFRQLELRGFFRRATPKGVNPRYLFSELKAFKEKAEEVGFLPLLDKKSTRDLANPQVESDGFATALEVATYLRISKVTIYERLKKGVFPKPVRYRAGCDPRWKIGTIRSYAVSGMGAI